MTKIPQPVIDHLRALSTGDAIPEQLACGVCQELIRKFKFVLDPELDTKGLTAFYSKWPKFSGCHWYPVPSPKFEFAMSAYTRERNLWAQDEYGDNRREFCGFLATQFELLNAELEE